MSEDHDMETLFDSEDDLPTLVETSDDESLRRFNLRLNGYYDDDYQSDYEDNEDEPIRRQVNSDYVFNIREDVEYCWNDDCLGGCKQPHYYEFTDKNGKSIAYISKRPIPIPEVHVIADSLGFRCTLTQ
jgi:hypothetical protein